MCRMNKPFSNTLVERMKVATEISVMTGAGVSAESGIATFRDSDGLWAKFKPQELANMDAFLGNPALVQAFYNERKRIATEASPNPGHYALADLEAELIKRGRRFTLITQNVDNLHVRAGNSNIIELHGNITRSYCIDCKRVPEEDDLMPAEDKDTLRCSSCEGLIRPDVVWFGEMLPYLAMQKAVDAAQRSSVFLSIGTSSVVYPAAEIPLVAGNQGAYVAEINIEASDIAVALDEVVIGKSGQVLPALVDALRVAWASDSSTENSID